MPASDDELDEVDEEELGEVDGKSLTGWMRKSWTR